MFEDIAKNHVAPRARGMTTVLVTGKPGQIDHRQAHDREGAPGFVDFVTDDLASFLGRVNGELALKPH
jgi:putative hydrolase of the HAD superfamily